MSRFEPDKEEEEEYYSKQTYYYREKKLCLRSQKRFCIAKANRVGTGGKQSDKKWMPKKAQSVQHKVAIFNQWILLLHE